MIASLNEQELYRRNGRCESVRYEGGRIIIDNGDPVVAGGSRRELVCVLCVRCLFVSFSSFFFFLFFFFSFFFYFFSFFFLLLLFFLLCIGLCWIRLCCLAYSCIALSSCFFCIFYLFINVKFFRFLLESILGPGSALYLYLFL